MKRLLLAREVHLAELAVAQRLADLKVLQRPLPPLLALRARVRPAPSAAADDDICAALGEGGRRSTHGARTPRAREPARGRGRARAERRRHARAAGSGRAGELSAASPFDRCLTALAAGSRAPRGAGARDRPPPIAAVPDLRSSCSHPRAALARGRYPLSAAMESRAQRRRRSDHRRAGFVVRRGDSLAKTGSPPPPTSAAPHRRQARRRSSTPGVVAAIDGQPFRAAMRDAAARRPSPSRCERRRARRRSPRRLPAKRLRDKTLKMLARR